MVDIAQLFTPRVEEMAHAALSNKQREGMANSPLVYAMADGPWLAAQQNRLNEAHLSALDLLAEGDLPEEIERRAIAAEYFARRELWAVRDEIATRAGKRGLLN